MPVSGDGLVLTDVAAFSANDLWAVGYEQIDQYHTGEVLLHRQGGSPWVRVSDPNPPSPTLDELYGVAVSSPGEAWAVGLFDGATLVDRYTNTCGTPQPTATAVPSATATLTPVPAPSQTRAATNTVPVQSTPIPTATVAHCFRTFSDVPPNSTFYSSIVCLVCRGIVSGYQDGTFRPGNSVTRGQIAKMVANAAGFEDDPGPQLFEDVPPGSTFYQWIQRLASRGFINGYDCGGPGQPCVAPGNRPYFRPTSNASRAQLSKIVSNAAGYNDAPIGQTFEDVPPSHTFYQWIQRLASRGIMSGYDCGGPGEPCVAPGNRSYFRLSSNVTRGQSAKIIANAFFPECRTQEGRQHGLKIRGV